MPRFLCWPLACLLGCGVSAPIWASTALYSESYSKCMDQSEGVTSRMIACIGTEYQRQDQRLNQHYQQVMSGLSSARKSQLRTVQRKWLTYRDADCQFYADPDGGSLARIEANTCLLRMTAERAEELGQMLSP